MNTQLENLRAALMEAWTLGSGHRMPSFEQLERWRTLVNDPTPTEKDEDDRLVREALDSIHELASAVRYVGDAIKNK